MVNIAQELETEQQLMGGKKSIDTPSPNTHLQESSNYINPHEANACFGIVCPSAGEVCFPHYACGDEDSSTCEIIGKCIDIT